MKSNHPRKSTPSKVSGARRALRQDADVARRHEIVRGAPLLPEIEEALDNYKPRAIPAADWESVADDVRAWFRLASPTDRPIALRLLLLFTRYALWAKRNHLPLDPNVLFTPVMIDRYVDSVVTSDTVLASDSRARFRRYGPVIGDPAKWPKPSTQISRIEVLPPLSPTQEQLALKVAASATVYHYAFCVLGFGFGLDGRWIPKVSADDLEIIDGWPHLHVPGPDPRVVPVRADYEKPILWLAEAVPDERFIGGPNNVQNRSSYLARTISLGTDRRLYVGEMRSTWFTAHLRNGTDFVYLAEIAGRKSFQRLLELLEHVEPQDRNGAARQARLA